jgi:hypothetical protein
MKRTVFSLVLAIVFVQFFMAGCAKTPTLYVTAALTYNAGTAIGVVSLTKNSSSGSGITGATVKFNNQVMTETGGGGYMAAVTGLTSGAAVSLSVSSSEGTASASGNLPTGSGASASFVISDAVAGSTMTLLNI